LKESFFDVFTEKLVLKLFMQSGVIVFICGEFII